MAAPVKGIVYRVTRDKKQHTQGNYDEFLFVNTKKNLVDTQRRIFQRVSISILQRNRRSKAGQIVWIVAVADEAIPVQARPRSAPLVCPAHLRWSHT